MLRSSHTLARSLARLRLDFPEPPALDEYLEPDERADEGAILMLMGATLI